jgi:hypothetical protein
LIEPFPLVLFSPVGTLPFPQEKGSERKKTIRFHGSELAFVRVFEENESQRME